MHDALKKVQFATLAKAIHFFSSAALKKFRIHAISPEDLKLVLHLRCVNPNYFE